MQTTLPQSVLHSVLGPLFIGACFNNVLFVLEVTQVGRYFSQHPLFPSRATTRSITTQQGRRLDRPWLRFLVLWMFVLDIVASITAIIIVYIYTITGWGDIETLQSHHPLISVHNISNTLSVIAMHLFLISRYYTLSKNKVFSTVLVIIVTGLFGLGMTIGTLTFTVDRLLKDRVNVWALVIASLVGSVVTDWLIAGAVIWHLAKLRTAINDKQGVIIRLIHMSFLSGFALAILALCCLIGFVTSPSTNITMVFSMVFGRVAALTVLFNLNSRSSLALAARGVSQPHGTSIYVDTTIEPGQFFGVAPDGRNAPGLVEWVEAVEAAGAREEHIASNGILVSHESKSTDGIGTIGEIESVQVHRDNE